MQGFLTQTPKSTRIKAFNNAAGERQEMKKRHYIEWVLQVKNKFYGGILTEVWADKLISFLGVLRSIKSEDGVVKKEHFP